MKNAKAIIWSEVVIASVVIALVVFGTAGTIDYWQGWAFLVAGGVATLLPTLAILQDPVLLESRTKGGPAAEQRPIQRLIVVCAGLAAVAAFVVPGLDHRFGWSSVPPWLSVAGDLLVVASLWAVYRVFKENSFGSTTVELAQGQRVISTGPYAIVRNPMYTCAAGYFVGMSLALGSYWGLVPAVLTVVGLSFRLVDEEKFLAQNLAGYAEYCAKVRWHLIPGIF